MIRTDYIEPSLHIRGVTHRVYTFAPMQYFLKTRFFISLLCSGAVFVPQAVADIYVNEHLESAAEIHLSNISALDGDEVLIQEPSPDTTTAIAQALPETVTVSLPFSAAVNAAALENSLDPALLHAVIAIESGHNPKAVSPRGAQGLMQLMPVTSRRFGLSNPFDPVQNIHAGARYLKELKTRFNGDLNLMLAAYNAGPGAVVRFGSHIPPFDETRRYVPRVLGIYRELCSRKM